jgi:hypothetical protein
MRSTMVGCAIFVLMLASAAPCAAQCYACSPVFRQPLGQAPDACGPGFYYIDSCGTIYGPNYCLYPYFPPFQGILPGQQRPSGPAYGTAAPMPMPMMGHPGMMGQPPYWAPGGPAGFGQAGIPSFPTHPFARSPRDFFMFNEAQAERHTRERRLSLLP